VGRDGLRLNHLGGHWGEEVVVEEEEEEEEEVVVVVGMDQEEVGDQAYPNHRRTAKTSRQPPYLAAED